MATDYEKVYRERRHALGEPTREIVAFFEGLKTTMRVLDVGCGQGRDALFIARLGHQVLGVDISGSGIQQLREDANQEKLKIEGIVANLLEYVPDGLFDIIIFDRTLHMLNAKNQLSALNHYKNYVENDGYVLINDQRKNLPAMEKLFLKGENRWIINRKMRGFLFLQKRS